MVSLGCSKNQVDAERLLARLRAAGYRISADAAACDAVIVNTCGFIEDAKRESIDAVLEYGRLKESGVIKALLVTGCMAERYRDEMARLLPEIDVLLGIGGNAAIVGALDTALAGGRMTLYGDKTDLPLEGERVLSTPPYTAYLKIAEGCDNCCSYCAIPDIRGPFRSRRLEDIAAEAEALVRGGVRELNVVAQDTTRYGEDLYGRYSLPRLLERLCAIDELRWLRILYCYPQRITDELLAVMRAQDKIVKYMDVPVQHASGKILRAMNRKGDAGELARLMAHIREQVPGVALRTTLITGFPGESEEQFEELCRFVREVRFDRLGCFAYSQEEGTPAADMPGQLDDELKRRRADTVMELQMSIAEQLGRGMIGRTLEVLCEGRAGDTGRLVGRSPADAPDIDTRVYFQADGDIPAGRFVRVRVTGLEGYDLTGRFCAECEV